MNSVSVQTNPEHDRRVTPLGTWWEHEGAQRFATLAALASELKTDRASLRNWMSGKRDPQRAQRERLHAITQLDYYSPQAVHDRMAARPKKRNANSGTSQTSSHAPSAQRFSDWFNRQTTYATQFELAQAVGVSRGTVRNMMAGRSFPRSDEICEKLHAATGLDCFGPGREAARAEHEWSIPRRVKADRMAKYRAKHPKRDRADKGKPRPERQHKVGDAALVRSLLLKGEPILLDPDNPKSRQIGRTSRSIEEIACDLGLGSKRETRVRTRLREIFGLSIVDKVAFAHGELLSTKWILRLQERFGVPSSRRLAPRRRTGVDRRLRSEIAARRVRIPCHACRRSGKAGRAP
jgi:transcriptional regulator with XRE-family HTH domain